MAESEIGIGAVAGYIPDERIDVLALKDKFQTTEQFLTEKVGMRRLARMPLGWDTSDLAAAAVRKLYESGAVAPEDIECLAVVTQNPDVRGLPQTAALVQQKVGLDKRILAYDISLGCSGYVAGLSILAGTLLQMGLKRGLLVTADPYSKIVDPDDRDTMLIFGDAATATLLTDVPVWRIGRTDFGSLGKLADSLSVDSAGKLSMNGRAVFNFAATEVPASVARCLSANGLTIEDIDRAILHQGSRFIVDTLANRLNLGSKARFYAGDYGNTVSSSIPLILERELSEGDRRLLLCGFGVGLSWATTVLEKIR
jgi:3-oxoacyl-[acyl-carrier-protein] synthase-3